MRRRGLFLCACALMLCLGGCGKDVDEKADTKTDTGTESEENREESEADAGTYSPIIAKNLDSVDKESEYPYEIQVNTKENCITVYGVDDTGKYIIPVRAMICSTGDKTPVGTFQLGDTSRWQMNALGEFSQYATRIVDDVVFQSAPYFSQNNQELDVEQFNQMGEVISGSSIQLEVADAKWIAKNCPEGTKVEISESSEEGPLGKPQARILKKKDTKDPTDTGKNAKKSGKYVPVEFEGVEDKVIGISQPCSLLDGVTACDSEENDLTAQIQVYGEIDFATPGVYEVTYMCRNSEQESRVVMRNIEVTDAAVLPSEEPGASQESQQTEESQQTDAPSPTPAAVAFPTPTPEPTVAPTPEPTAEPTPAPTQQPAQTPVPTQEPAVDDITTIQVYHSDTTPPVIRLVAGSRYVKDVSRETLAARVRVNDDSGMLQDLYITVQQMRGTNLYVVVYEAVDYAGNGSCISETVEVISSGVVFR